MSASSRSRGSMLRLVPSGRVLEVGYAFAEAAYPLASCAPGATSSGSRPGRPRGRRHERLAADVRA